MDSEGMNFEGYQQELIPTPSSGLSISSPGAMPLSQTFTPSHSAFKVMCLT